MPIVRDNQIRERAYQLWEQAGRPHGQAIEHWLRAESELNAKPKPLRSKTDASRKPSTRKARPS